MAETVVVLGSGPIRIGQGIEFDYSCVHCVWTLRDLGYRPILINNNPETVSTDFDTSDGLYFEPLRLEDVVPVIRREQAKGVVCQFGGQSAINLARPLANEGLAILGTQPEAIEAAEDRRLFDDLLTELGVQRPQGRAVHSLEEAHEVAKEVGYPVLVRPSFVLGGRAMEIVHRPEQLETFYRFADDANPGQPILVDRFLQGIEAELDVISDGTDVLVPGVMEHVERAGVHSGDSMAIYPPISLNREMEWRMIEIATHMAQKLGVKGLLNIQFVIHEGTVYVIEANPRASRTVPFISKVTGLPMVGLATACLMGHSLSELGYGSGLWCSDRSTSAQFLKGLEPRVAGRAIARDEYLQGDIKPSRLFAVKAPVFSFQKLSRIEPSLGPEMKSTGEVMGVDSTPEAAIYKALIGAGTKFKADGPVALTLSDQDKEAGVELARRLQSAGYSIVATVGTRRYLAEQGIECEEVPKVQECEGNLLDQIRSGAISLMINTPGNAADSTDEAKQIRRACIEMGIACITNIDTALALAKAIEMFRNPELTSCLPYTDYR